MKLHGTISLLRGPRACHFQTLKVRFSASYRVFGVCQQVNSLQGGAQSTCRPDAKGFYARASHQAFCHNVIIMAVIFPDSQCFVWP